MKEHSNRRARHLRSLCAAIVGLGLGPGVLADDGMRLAEPRIVGGLETELCQGAATVSIGGCDATLVHPRLILTAAHCISDEVRSVSFGALATEPAFTVELARCEVHPGYRKQQGTDIAFCLLETPVDTPYTLPVATCETAMELTSNTWLRLIGHGRREASDGGDGRARYVDVQVQATRAEGREILVGDADRGACHGDSGGSAYVALPDGSLRFAGVISRRGPLSETTHAASDCAATTVVTAVRPHLAWLETASQIDLMPCHDGLGWNPGPGCSTFVLDPFPLGTWADGCETAWTRPVEPTCLAPEAVAAAASCGTSTATGSPRAWGMVAVLLWIFRLRRARTRAAASRAGCGRTSVRTTTQP